MLYSVLVESVDYFGPKRAQELGLYMFSGLLIVLQILHIFWFYTIAKMIFKLVTTGIEKDERSDDDDDEVVVDEGSTGSHSGSHDNKHSSAAVTRKKKL